MAEVSQTKDRYALPSEAPIRSGSYDRAVSIGGAQHSFAPIAYSAYLVQLKALQLRAGISIPLSAHVGRHTFATLITLERGVPIKTVSRMLGHSSIQTTERYAHVTPKKLFDEFERFFSFTEDLQLSLCL